MSFVSSLIGGILGSGAASSASQAEQTGAQQAEQNIQQNQNAAISAQNTALSKVTGAEQPYQAVGSTAANNLVNLLNKGFTAPTLAQAEQTPGYQFTLGQGTQAIDENAAATGNLMSGTTGTALEKYGEGLASTYYQQAYQNAMNSYLANVNTAEQGTQLGENSTAQLANANLQTAGMTTNTDLTAAQMLSQQYNNAAAARAQGILGQAGAWSNAAGGMLGGFGNMSSDSSSLQNLANFAFA